VSQDGTAGTGSVARRRASLGNLVQQCLDKVVIAAVNKDNLKVDGLQSFAYLKTTKSTSNNSNTLASRHGFIIWTVDLSHCQVQNKSGAIKSGGQYEHW
jgi:hypothetical protein